MTTAMGSSRRSEKFQMMATSLGLALEHELPGVAPLRRRPLATGGDCEGAHAIVQDDPSPLAAWMHGVAHLLEGDVSNARYWYGCAGRAFPRGGRGSGGDQGGARGGRAANAMTLPRSRPLPSGSCVRSCLARRGGGSNCLPRV